jgi:hypothetical protein
LSLEYYELLPTCAFKFNLRRYSVEIPGSTFPVAEYRLEDAIEATGYICEPDSEFAIGAEPSKAGALSSY